MPTSNSTTVPASGISFTGLLALLLIGLRLGGVIQWPWLWVLSPLWIPLALALVCAAFVVFAILARDAKKKGGA